MRGIAIPYQKKFREAIADLFGYLEERLAGTEDIRSSGAVDFVLLGIYKLSVHVLRHLALGLSGALSWCASPPAC